MEITPLVHQLTIPFTVPIPGRALERSVNLFIVLGPRVTLIDSGVAGAESKVFNYLGSLSRAPREIATLVLTHSHPDHIGAARTIQQRTHCQIWAHGVERNWIEDTALQMEQRPVPGFNSLVAGPVRVARELDDGELLALTDSRVFKVLHTPGHSAGSISLWDEEERMLITGDAVPVPWDLPILDDPVTALDSLRRLIDHEAEILLSAWDVPKKGKDVRKTLERGIDWLLQIGEAVREESAGKTLPDPMEFCHRVAKRLALPPQAANPLVARTFMAYLKARSI
jgi:glyoxylase-like metal-dependent hydrolase (beta-lactamase superfamily II)